MTERKEQILHTALQLFSKYGVNSTSTSRIAKESKVSEGLIFRHFGNKEGLLSSIIEFGKEKAQQLFLPIFNISDPKERLKAILEIPFDIPKEDYSFWKLLYSLKWQTESYDSEMSDTLKQQLIQTLLELGIETAEVEAEFIMILFDGISTSLLLKGIEHKKTIKALILKRYELD